MIQTQIYIRGYSSNFVVTVERGVNEGYLTMEEAKEWATIHVINTATVEKIIHKTEAGDKEYINPDFISPDAPAVQNVPDSKQFLKNKENGKEANTGS